MFAPTARPKSNGKDFHHGAFNFSSLREHKFCGFERRLVTRGASVRTDATAGKKDSKVKYPKLISIINS